jgi:hypothetical protein
MDSESVGAGMVSGEIPGDLVTIGDKVYMRALGMLPNIDDEE